MFELVKKVEPRMILLLLGGVFILLTSVVTTSLVIPQYKRLAAATHLEGLLQTTRSSSQELAKPFAETKVEIAAMEQELHGEMANLPMQQLESYIVGKLQEVSWESKMELTSISPLSGGKVRDFKETVFAVELSGKYADFFDWLQILNRELGFVLINSFEIVSGDSAELNPELNVKLTMVSYRVIADE